MLRRAVLFAWIASFGILLVESAAADEPARPLLALHDLTFTDSCEASSSVLWIDELEVRDRQVGLFTLRGVEEVEMRGVRGRLSSCGDTARGEEPAAMGPDQLLALGVRDLTSGVVTRISAQPVDLVLHRGGIDLAHVRAGHLEVGRGLGTRLDGGLAIEASDGASLRATRAVWQVRDRKLFVVGAYQWVAADGSRRDGRDGRFAIESSGTLRPEP